MLERSFKPMRDEDRAEISLRRRIAASPVSRSPRWTFAGGICGTLAGGAALHLYERWHPAGPPWLFVFTVLGAGLGAQLDRRVAQKIARALEGEF